MSRRVAGPPVAQDNRDGVHCKKAFRKDMTTYEEADEFCPHCDNHYVIEAKEPKAMVGVEGEDARVDARMLKDDRVKGMEHRSLFAEKDLTDKVDRPIWEQFEEYQKKQPRPQ
ncbi:hypothetical protein DB88DRAFT_509579 [Papiliotrema laurentii]|uniref:Zinc finger protein n=1 Tax=Papiliotrema laurentii TaxID=5418 RepID=A0AAD9FTN8_PAPLA|nr:hypothetical protein DB88DRAFT_509579 [Papiliotrema laurentii]